ncbi:MAG TPA: AarF/UbiB family protein [Kofleriaceae bacterium]|nr:AarF/UbiB family protein [Kofleriaceae bacterium]
MDAARRSLLDADAAAEKVGVTPSARPGRGAPAPGEERTGRPPTRAWRFVVAYWCTFRVIGSYLWIRFWARWRNDAWLDRRLREAHLRNAKRIERTICRLQGLFIKVGQLISIMTNFLPEEFRRQLEGLQDHVPPRPYPDIEARVRAEWGKGPKELFAEFAERPIASASIGQVHKARLLTGEEVAVKVQYPDIDQIVTSDLRTLRRILAIVQWFVPYQGLDDVYREIRAIVVAELDFRAEADNGDRIAANFEGRTDIAFPQVVRELSSERMLTTRFEVGVKIVDGAGAKAMGLDRRALAKQVVELYCQQIFTDGVYHADPHPGNLLVRPLEGAEPGIAQIVFLDFGAVATISPQFRQGIVELIQGGLTRDTPRIVRAMRQMGFVAKGADDRVFEQVVEYFHDRFNESISLDTLNLKDLKLDPEKTLEKSLESLADLRRMDISLRELSENFHVPKEAIVLERTLLLLMGLCTELDPTLNPMTVIKPYIERFVLGDQDWSGILLDTSRDMVMQVAALPGEMRRFLRTAHAGDMKVRFANLEPSAQLMYRLGHQGILAAIGIAGASIAIVLEGRSELERAEWAWWTARVAGAFLVLSWWNSRSLLRKKR